MSQGYPIKATSGQTTYYAFLPYYPKRFTVSTELDSYRKVVYDFKNGKTGANVGQAMARMVNEGLKHFHPSMPNNWWLCIVPASTERKTQIRFSNFCTHFCKNTGFNNGYNLIYNTGDREAWHITNERRDVLECIDFYNIYGKNILLFDDIMTTGRSFKKISEALLERGAHEVVGLFLGQTCHLSSSPFMKPVEPASLAEEAKEVLDIMMPHTSYSDDDVLYSWHARRQSAVNDDDDDLPF